VRITTKDISKLANVSRTTVYRALHDQAGINTETKSKVLQIARSLQYHPNRLGMALAKKKTIVIGVITLPQNNPFSGELLKGIESARDELKDFELSLKVSAMEGLEPARQARMIRTLLDDSADGIAIDALDSPEVREAVNDATDADVPVVTYNSDLKGSRRVCFVGQDLFKSGQVAAVEEGMDDDFISYDRTLQALKRHPDIQGIYAVAAGIRGLGKALGESGRAGEVRVVCNDLVPETAKLIAEGMIDASIVQDPISQGRLAVKILFDCLFEGRGLLREVYYTETGIVTKHLL